MEKLDLRKKLKHLYAPSAREFSLVEVPKLGFMATDGAGDPNTSQRFQDAMNALYTASYTLKFMFKKGQMGREVPDYSVMPPEGLWWMDDMSKFNLAEKGRWRWTVMIAQPGFVGAQDVRKAVEAARKRKPLPGLSGLRFERFEEGLSAQILYTGPFADEGPTIQAMHRFIEDRGLVLRGKHHEIYLSDFRRTKPEKLRTVIRQPASKK